MNRTHNTVLILGYGEMGHAMQHLLQPHSKITIWDPYFKGDLPVIDLEQVASEVSTIIFCTPTAPLFELASRLNEVMSPDCLCLSMAKALDKQGRTAPQALQQGLSGAATYGVLYGPMIAEEILADRPAFATVAASTETALSRACALFQPTDLVLKSFDDTHGAAWCAVLKNIYALLFGMADELQLGTNVRGFLSVAVLEEMAEIMRSMGGDDRTPYTLAGLGDLITTATSLDSHHHELGCMVARGERDNLTGEGINTLNVLLRKQLIDIKQFPLLALTAQIIQNGKDARTHLQQYLRKQAG